MQLPPLSLYIHYPWCIKKCPYCDFNSHTITNDRANYIDALLFDFENDIKYIQNRELQTIFIGGGTPSLMSVAEVERLITGIKSKIKLAKNIEITLEANPSSADMVKFDGFRNIINRLSIGVQSFDDNLLQTISRTHNANEAKNAIKMAKTAGFDNFNIDLMYGLESQNKQQILTDIKSAIKFTPSHISFYQLTIEKNTLFAKYPPKLPDDDVLFDAEYSAKELLEHSGYKQYEISAYSKIPSKHNLNYWYFGDYLGIGAGAHGKITLKNGDIIRTLKPKSPNKYLQSQIGKYKIVKNIAFEFMLNALRLKAGFRKELFETRTQIPIVNIMNKLKKAENMELLTITNNKIIPSNKGFNFLNDLQALFLDDNK